MSNTLSKLHKEFGQCPHSPLVKHLSTLRRQQYNLSSQSFGTAFLGQTMKRRALNFSEDEYSVVRFEHTKILHQPAKIPGCTHSKLHAFPDGGARVQAEVTPPHEFQSHVSTLPKHLAKFTCLPLALRLRFCGQDQELQPYLRLLFPSQCRSCLPQPNLLIPRDKHVFLFFNN